MDPSATAVAALAKSIVFKWLITQCYDLLDIRHYGGCENE